MAGKKILLVDDEPAIIKIVRKRLEQHHYEVTTASDGLEGLERALADRPDLISPTSSCRRWTATPS